MGKTLNNRKYHHGEVQAGVAVFSNQNAAERLYLASRCSELADCDICLFYFLSIYLFIDVNTTNLKHLKNHQKLALRSEYSC